MNCDKCGAEMRPLFLPKSFFCPNDCDIRAPEPVLLAQEYDDFVHKILDNLWDDSWDDEPTAEYCPSCSSSDVGPFVVPGTSVTTHCNSCGKVW